MSFSRPIQWYYSHADLIWPDGTFKNEGLTWVPAHEESTILCRVLGTAVASTSVMLCPKTEQEKW